MLDRSRKLKSFSGLKEKSTPGKIVYWMQRDQRVDNNFALAKAMQTADQNNVDLIIIFCLVDNFLRAGWRHYRFMLQGLAEVEERANSLRIPFVLLRGDPTVEIPRFLHKNDVWELHTDFNPLRLVKSWKSAISKLIQIPFIETDSHNLVPVWMISTKQEFGAYTLRPKYRKYQSYLEESFPRLYPRNTANFQLSQIDWQAVELSLSLNRDIRPVPFATGGREVALEKLASFAEKKWHHYDSKGNDPNADVLSGLSPYLHYGQIGAAEVIQFLQSIKSNDLLSKGFYDEILVRRELADNFCFYNENYDNYLACPRWAQKTLEEHLPDRREYLYNLDHLETASTHDLLWNAAQMEMVNTGKMHGYMRMYWAKKILEWTEHPKLAIEYAIYLNDKYELDGRDPNGYAGILWSICGLHDRAWAERPIFGKVRYMNDRGARRKFNVDEYIAKQKESDQLKNNS